MESQLGSGLHGGETAIAHLYVRSLLEVGTVTKQTCALLFLDIVTAFASMARGIVFDVTEGDEQWLRRSHQVGFTDVEAKDIHAEACAPIWGRVRPKLAQ